MAEAPTSEGGTVAGLGDMALTDIKEPGDADVLCGRGGAALRHPGNQTYRRLVNLNKGLYITCLKTEKLKISRSIVAAIREQKGRFLEKDNKKETWYDIGDKKAIEKTSQALREGQPKLRQKIVEMGGGPAGTAAFMESQYGHHTSLYNPDQVGMAQPTLDRATSGASSTNGNGVMPGSMAAAHAAQQQSLQQEMQQGNNGNGNTSQHDFDTAMLQRLSIHSHAEENPAAALLQQQARLRPSLTTRASVAQELGITESQLSLMSEFSAFNGSVGTLTNESLMSIETSYRRALNMSQNTHNQSSVAGSQFSIDQFSIGTSTNSVGINSSINTFNSGNGTNSSANAFGGASGTNIMAAPPTVNPKQSVANQKRDRRRDFARMKFQRPPSARNPGGARREPPSAATMASSSSQRSFGDGMPDIHMVESTLSLHSTASNMSGVEGARGKDSESKPAVAVESVKLSDGPGDRRERLLEGLPSGSRHSIMSGLSRISDSSIDHSIFSDLSRKIGDVSTRSLAMSEISAIDIQEREDEDTTGPRPNGAPSFDGHPLETTPGYRKTQPAMDFDL